MCHHCHVVGGLGNTHLPSKLDVIRDYIYSCGLKGVVLVRDIFVPPLLTLRGLRLFPISNTGISIAYILATVHFLYPKLGSFSDMEYYFYPLAYRDSNQMQCSPSFDWNWGKQNDPTACWHQLHPRFLVLQQGKCFRYPPERVGRVTETTNCVGGEGAAPPSNPH